MQFVDGQPRDALQAKLVAPEWATNLWKSGPNSPLDRCRGPSRLVSMSGRDSSAWSTDGLRWRGPWTASAVHARAGGIDQLVVWQRNWFARLRPSSDIAFRRPHRSDRRRSCSSGSRAIADHTRFRASLRGSTTARRLPNLSSVRHGPSRRRLRRPCRTSTATRSTPRVRLGA